MSKPGMTFSASLLLCIFSSAAVADDHPCVTHFTTQGSFLAGKQYQTWQELPAVNKNDAYTKIYVAILKDGWKVSQADREVGVISAAQDVSFGNGKTTPLNIVIESAGDGVKIIATSSTSGGVAAKAKSVQDSLCSYLKAAEAT